MAQTPAQPLRPSAPLIALAGWLVPGAGYWLLGQRPRALVVGITIVLLFILGLFFGGIRVIDVPGYNKLGQRIMLRVQERQQDQIITTGQWALRVRPFAELADKPWFIPQSLMGPINFLAAQLSLYVSAAESRSAGNSWIAPSHARIFEIGTLYTAIAGMLNLLAIIDSTAQAAPAPKSVTAAPGDKK